MDKTYEVSLRASAEEMQNIASDLQSNEWLVDLSSPPNLVYRFQGDNWKGASSELSRCLRRDDRIIKVIADNTRKTVMATSRKLKAAMLLDGNFAGVKQQVKEILE